MNAGADARERRRLLVHLHREPVTLEQARHRHSAQACADYGDAGRSSHVDSSRMSRLILNFIDTQRGASAPIRLLTTLAWAMAAPKSNLLMATKAPTPRVGANAA